MKNIPVVVEIVLRDQTRKTAIVRDDMEKQNTAGVAIIAIIKQCTAHTSNPFYANFCLQYTTGEKHYWEKCFSRRERGATLFSGK